MPVRLPPLLSLMSMLMAGCSGDNGRFPSLAPRPIEAIDIAGEPAAMPRPPIADPVRASAARAARARAADGDRAFVVLAAEVEPQIRAAAGEPAGSERWTGAQVALSRLQAARGPASDALRVLDEQRVGADDPEVEAAFAAVSTIDAAQSARITALSALLRPE